MNQWYQAVVPRDYAIEKFYQTEGFLGSVERDNALILYFEKTPEMKKKIKELNLSVISEGDWVEKWREYFKPVKMGAFTVVPPWDSRSGNIVINPSRGFGTGHHETTRLASSLIQKVLAKDKEIKTLIDVGTGSGILSITAVKKRPDLKVTGIDSDKEAIENAFENLVLNDMVGKIDFSSDPVFKFEKPFDVVAANIISSVLFSLRDDLRRLSARWLILSGVLESETEFLKKMDLDDFELIEEVSENEWRGFLLRRRENG